MTKPKYLLNSTPPLPETPALASVSINAFTCVDTSINRYYTRHIST